MFKTISTISLSIFLEGIFFLLIGILISGIIQKFVSDSTIKRIIPKNRFLGLFIASLTGLIFPICECGIVPVVHRLIKKGLPIHYGITMLLASPIVNIVVLVSTSYAFTNYTEMVFVRGIGGVVISFIAGLIVSFWNVEDIKAEDSHTCSETCGCSSEKHSFFKHSIEEFFSTGKYFLMGVIITGILQTVISGDFLFKIGNIFPVGNIVLMVYPYFLSICSNTDAFIARSLFNVFSFSAVSGFLIFGAMFDLKTTLMLKKVFKGQFIIKLFVTVFLLVLIYSTVINFIYPGA